MIGLLQRVTSAQVAVAGREIARIDRGLLVFIGIEKDDGEPQATRLLERLLRYRVFPDAQGRMNLSLEDTKGGLLLVPQFTLAADTATGTRPGFSMAAPPALARSVFTQFVAQARALHPLAGAGEFGADMQVSLVNDGPVTFWLESR